MKIFFGDIIVDLKPQNALKRIYYDLKRENKYDTFDWLMDVNEKTGAGEKTDLKDECDLKDSVTWEEVGQLSNRLLFLANAFYIIVHSAIVVALILTQNSC